LFNSRFASTGADQVIRNGDLSQLDGDYEKFCRLANRNLTRAERETFIGGFRLEGKSCPGLAESADGAGSAAWEPN